MATTAEQLKYATNIITALSRGPGTPCSQRGYHWWTSTVAAERQQAARLCANCPVLQACGQQATANRETRHVWGGRDYGP